MSDNLYADIDDVKLMVGIDDSNDDFNLIPIVTAACRWIDSYCNRRFYADTEATARTFYASDGYSVDLLQNGSEFYTTSGLIVATDDNGAGTYGTTWDEGDFRLSPQDGVVDGVAGWPYRVIETAEDGALLFPYRGNFRRVQITAKWGWAAVPEPVSQAAKIVAKDLFKNKDMVGGVAGTDAFGAVRARMDPMVQMLLAPYRRLM